MRRVRGARRALVVVGMAVAASVTVFAGAAWAPPAPDAGVTATRTELVVDGVSVASFTRCIGLGSETEVILYQDGSGGGPQQLPGDTTSDGMVCERALSADMALASWRATVEDGTVGARKDAAVVVYDASGVPVLRWELDNAWPSQLTNAFDANGVGREIVTFESDRTRRVAP